LNQLANRETHNNELDKIKQPTLKVLSIATTIGLILGFMGPFGSYKMPVVSRYIYWVVIFNLGYFIYFAAHRITNRYLKDKAIHPYVLFVMPTLMASIPLSLLVGFATQFLIDVPFGFFAISLHVMPQVLILGIIIDVLMGLILNKDKTQTKQAIDKAGQMFMNRLPANIGENLICFMMEDHYLNAYTDKGNHMLLMRMKDALIELENYHGMQVHRSYWVALDAVTKVQKENRKTILVMKNGIKIPVSRKFSPSIKAAGLF
jgi:hypothetical protein